MQTTTARGSEIPRLGFGTIRMPGGDCRPVVESALALGPERGGREASAEVAGRAATAVRGTA